MSPSVEMLLNKMAEDKAFAEKVLIQTEKEKIIEIAKEEGIDLTMEGIDEANAVIAKVLQSQTEGELSEEELENVSGGLLGLTLLISGSAVSGVSLISAGTVTMVSTAVSVVSTAATVSATVSAAVTLSVSASVVSAVSASAASVMVSTMVK